MSFIKFKPLTSRFYLHVVLKPEDVKDEVDKFLAPGEDIVSAYKASRDLCIFTNKRIILIDKRGIRGFCRTIYSIRYSAISSYALNIHTIDSSIDLTIDSGYKLSVYFRKPIPLENMFKIYEIITDYVLNKK